jgi:hypothetical protein
MGLVAHPDYRLAPYPSLTHSPALLLAYSPLAASGEYEATVRVGPVTALRAGGSSGLSHRVTVTLGVVGNGPSH